MSKAERAVPGASGRGPRSTELELDRFFRDHPESRRIHAAVAAAVRGVGAEVRVSKSQIAFRRARGFAWTWIPSRSLSGERPPLVLSLAFRRRDPSSRWKQVGEPTVGWFMHHLELRSPDEVDEQVLGWIRKAWEEAGPR